MIFNSLIIRKELLKFNSKMGRTLGSKYSFKKNCVKINVLCSISSSLKFCELCHYTRSSVGLIFY